MIEKIRSFKSGPAQRDRWTADHSRIMYFGYYLAIGAFLPYIYLYYERMGFNGLQIGTLAALTVFAGTLGALFLSGIADIYTWHSQILRLGLLLCSISIYILSQANSFTALIVIVILYALSNSPIIPILDSSALVTVKSSGITFGNLRLWGTIGWSISTLLVGILIENYDLRWLFYCYITFMMFTFLLSLMRSTRIPHLSSPLTQGLHHLLRPNFLIFLLAIFFVSMTNGAFHSFFSIYLYGIGATERFIGFAWTLASLSEIPVMLGSGYIIQKIGAGGLLKVSFVTYAFRWLILSFISTPFWALLVQLLHGLSFAAFLVGGVTYIYKLAPVGLGTTGQAIFNSVSFGLGSIIGSLVAGYFYDTWGLSAMFRLLFVIAIIGLIVFYLSDRLQTRTKMVPI